MTDTGKMPEVGISQEILDFTRDLFDQLLNERLEVAFHLEETLRLIETGYYTQFHGKPEGFKPNENRAEFLTYKLTIDGVEMFGKAYARWDTDETAGPVEHMISWEDLGDGWMAWAQKQHDKAEEATRAKQESLRTRREQRKAEGRQERLRQYEELKREFDDDGFQDVRRLLGPDHGRRASRVRYLRG